MFMGEWTDNLGVRHTRGKADLLLTPCIDLSKIIPKTPLAIPLNTRADISVTGIWMLAVPLWVECKSGGGKLEAEQKLFRDHVIKAGNFYIEAHDSADALIAWFQQMGVRR